MDISYLVYLPLEAQSVMQYLGCWFPNLVVSDSTGVFFIILWSFCRICNHTKFDIPKYLSAKKNIAKINSIVSIWKIFLPIAITRRDVSILWIF